MKWTERILKLNWLSIGRYVYCRRVAYTGDNSYLTIYTIVIIVNDLVLAFCWSNVYIAYRHLSVSSFDVFSIKYLFKVYFFTYWLIMLGNCCMKEIVPTNTITFALIHIQDIICEGISNTVCKFYFNFKILKIFQTKIDGIFIVYVKCIKC